MQSPNQHPSNSVIEFWFNELTPKDWFTKSSDLDNTMKIRFGELQQQAACNELYQWRNQAESALAEIILLDQFSRNIYRDSAQSFACDEFAVALVLQAVDKGFDQQLTAVQRGFIYMPFMHSESLTIHALAVEYFTALGNEQQLEYEYKHKAIIERFGRYPHRNAILGRTSSSEETLFLEQPNSSF